MARCLDAMREVGGRLLGMSQLTRNVAANYAGRGWSAVMSLAFVPLYIKYMGIEAYGLVGFFVTLQALFVVLDVGLSTTLNRELARSSVTADESQRMRDLVRTLEIIYWCLAVCIGAVVVLMAPSVARYWVRAERLPITGVQQAVALMGIVMVFQWPSSLYSGGLLGLRRQVLYNVVSMGVATLRGVGSVLVLWLISPTIVAFFAWQVVVSASGTALNYTALSHSLPHAPQAPRFSSDCLFSVWRFAAGMSAISVVSVLLTQLDKVILSRMLTLEMFGYYSLAGAVASSLYGLISPVFTALFPEMSRFAALGDERALTRLYHRGSQMMSTVTLPVAVVLALFSPDILLLWTRNVTTMENTHVLLTLLVIGTAVHGLMHMPYALQLAHGWTRLALYINSISVAVVFPVIVVLTWLYGAMGGAIVWVLLTVGWAIASPVLTHRRLLRGSQWRWYAVDIGLPLTAAIVTAGAARCLVSLSGPFPASLLTLALVLTLTAVASVSTAPELRAIGIEQFRKARLAIAH